MSLEKNSAETKAQELCAVYDKMWAGIYKKDAGNNRSVYGDFFEDIVMKFIKDKIKKNLKICKGLIKKGDELSPQIDIIVYSGKAIYKGSIMPIGVVDSKNVKMILEVKAYLDKTKISNIRAQMKELKRFCPSAKKCIFTSQLIGVTNDQDSVRGIFDFVDDFVILCRKDPHKNKYILDFGKGLLKFLNTLSKI